MEPATLSQLLRLVDRLSVSLLARALPLPTHLLTQYTVNKTLKQKL